MAHKKAAWSAKNLRDSNPKYRGVKLFGGQTATAWAVIIRQTGDKFQVGRNVYKGRDFTLHAAIDGVVSFSKKNVMRFDGRRYLKTIVNVVTPEEFAAAHAQTKKTATKKETPAKAEKKATTTKKPVAKKATTAKKPAAKKTTTKATTKTTATKKTTTTKKTTAKKATTAKKPTAKKTTEK